MICDSVLETVGKTPLVRLNRIGAGIPSAKNPAELLVKVEYFNPAKSIKDRIGLRMIEAARESGWLKSVDEGGRVIEATSGNTGIAVAMAGAVLGVPVTIVMPEHMSEERKKVIRAYGAELVLTSKAGSFEEACAVAKSLEAENDGAVLLNQFENTANSRAHFETTAPEIFGDCDNKVDYIVAGVGSGGTIQGIGEYIRANNLPTKLIAVEPEESNVINGFEPGDHEIQGIGDGFIPGLLDTSVFAECMAVASDDAVKMARRLAKEEGILSGISAGATVAAAVRLASMSENASKRIVAIVADMGERYFSTRLFEEQ